MSQSISLFRPEVVAQQRLRLWGEVGLALPVSGRLLTAVLVLVVGGTVTFLATGEYHRKEHVRGVLRAAHGTWRVQAESPGVVAAVLVHPGSLVRAGQPLVRLHSVSKLPDGRAADGLLVDELDRQLQAIAGEQKRESARAVLLQQRLRGRLTGLEAELVALRATTARQQLLTEFAREQLSRIEVLARAGQIPVAQLRTAQAEHVQRAQVAADAELQLRNKRTEALDLRFEAQQAPYDADARAAALVQRASDLRQRRIEMLGARGTSVSAPITGVVSEVYVNLGEQIARERPLLSLTRVTTQGIGQTQSAVEAVLLVPSRAAGFIRRGQVVKLRYEAFPYQRFGTFAAEVINVDAALQMPGEVDVPLLVQEPVLRVRARLRNQFIAAYGQRLPLRPGLAFDADVLLERRSLLQWLFDPLRAQLRQ